MKFNTFSDDIVRLTMNENNCATKEHDGALLLINNDEIENCSHFMRLYCLFVSVSVGKINANN